MTIIHWNIRGFKANFEELVLLCNRFQPSIVGLQETFLKTSSNATLKSFNVFRKCSPTGNAVGGAALLIKKNILFSEVILNTRLQAVAARVSLKKTITFCSLYLPPSENVTAQEVEELIEQLPVPFVLMGDFNGHSPLWGSDHYNNKGSMLEKVFADRNLCVMNDGSHTYCHPGTGSLSCLDLTVCHPSLVLDFDWKVLDDSYGSDHFPVCLTPTGGDDDSLFEGWVFKKANWDYYSEQCLSRLKEEDIFCSVDEPTSVFTKLLLEIAKECIPKRPFSLGKVKVPWFNSECREALKLRKKAKRHFFRYPVWKNHLAYKQSKAKVRCVIKEARKESWKRFCSNLNSKTKSGTVWKAIKKIKGKKGSASINHLKVDGKLITDKAEVANVIAQTIESNSSAINYSNQFQAIKQVQERKACNFLSDNSECYNMTFSLNELKQAIQKSSDSAPGFDDIHYRLLSNLPEPCLYILLRLFNDIWCSGKFPSDWQEAIIIPIPKPGKDHSNPSNYRPIALTSCLCKTMERMVNARLTWVLEHDKLLANSQCGFRKNRSTVDHLVRFETFIREGFARKEHTVAVFFDLEKAYDTTWKHGILRDLHDMGFRGRLPVFIQGFLSNRLFCVKLNDTRSDFCSQEMGVPQGSILSPMLFNIKINNIVKSVFSSAHSSLFVDDFSLAIRGKSLHLVERQLQLCINAVQKWVMENGFKFSLAKTECIHFCKMRKVFPEPDIKLNGTSIKVVQEAKFLGLTFDCRLNFLKHIENLKNSCLKALDILRVVGHTDWGADRTVLLRLYRALIRSKLDYGCVVYGSAPKSYLKKLDTIHHQGLRIALGAFRTSPVQSLYVEAQEPSLSLRRLKMTLNYMLKLKALPDNPAHRCVFGYDLSGLFESRPGEIPPLSVRMREHFELFKEDAKNVIQISFTDIPFWTLQPPAVRLDLTEFKKSSTNAEIFKQHFLSLCAQYPSYKRIYTDGSKDDAAVAAAAILNTSLGTSVSERLHEKTSVYTAELKALVLALKLVKRSKCRQFLICSDSLSALQSLKSVKLDHPYLLEVHQLLTQLINSGKEIVFVWVPGHVGIQGNTSADSAAKDARSNPSLSENIVFSDLKPIAHAYVNQRWQEEWDQCVENKLHSFLPTIRAPLDRCRASRKEETVLCRLHIGHSYLTHSYLLKGEDPPVCELCGENLSVKHFLIHCVSLQEIRFKYYNADSMKVLFRDVPPDYLLNFVREASLFYRI